MPNNLSDSQSSILRSIFGAAPDSAVSSLESALAGEVARGGAMAAVHGLVAQEAANRRTRAYVFMPFLTLCRSGRGPHPRFPTALPGLLWAALREVSPGAARAAEALGPCEDEDDRAFADDLCNALCRTALTGLRAGDAPFAAVRALLNETPGQADLFLGVLELSPLVRSAVARLPVWMGRLNEEKAVAIRLAYNDAADLTEDGGPRLLEIISAHMTEPWRILHLISAIMDRPNDRFAAASEIARFGDYLMDDIDHRLAEFRAYDPSQGRAAGTAAAAILHNASLEIAEFETSIELSRDGPWGGRIAKQKQSVAQLAEARLAQIDKALDSALPVTPVKFGKGVRGFPKLNDDPEPAMLRKAESLLAFFLASRASANQSGFGSSRAKAGERMDGRIDQYVEDLLELMRAEEVPNLARIKAYLNAAADLIAVARGDQAAAIIRRRAAA